MFFKWPPLPFPLPVCPGVGMWRMIEQTENPVSLAVVVDSQMDMWPDQKSLELILEKEYHHLLSFTLELVMHLACSCWPLKLLSHGSKNEAHRDERKTVLMIQTVPSDSSCVMLFSNMLFLWDSRPWRVGRLELAWLRFLFLGTWRVLTDLDVSGGLWMSFRNYSQDFVIWGSHVPIGSWPPKVKDPWWMCF